MSLSVVVVYHSGYGHTAKVARYIAEGARSVAGTETTLINVTDLDESGWQKMDAADAIVFGAPTYMGGVSAKYKEFIDGASKRWYEQRWKNKIAAGFTNSGSISGDKLSVLLQLHLNAMQHSMIWVGTGILPPMDGEPNDKTLNRFGSYMGVMTQSTNDSPDVTPPAGDLETARLLGVRVAEVTAQFRK